MAVVMMGSSEEKPTFHDFLGMRCEEAPVPVPATTNSAAVPAAWEKGRENMTPELEASLGASSGGPGLITGYCDLRSGRKRSISDSATAATINDWMLPVESDSLESLHLMKVLGKDVVGEPPLGDGRTMFSMQPPPRPSSLILHPPISGLSDSLTYKWERSAPRTTRQMMHYRSGMIECGNVERPSASFAYKDRFTGVARRLQVAAYEGSRTGIRGCGTSSVANPNTGAAEKNSSMVLPCSSSRPNIYSTASAGRQMTIFYAGQVHVFDNVHPNKADLIMALAGSIGGSWSTTYSAKPRSVPVRVAEAQRSSRDSETGNLLGLFTRGNSSQKAIVNDSAGHLSGGHLGGAGDTRPAVDPAAEPETLGKRDA